MMYEVVVILLVMAQLFALAVRCMFHLRAVYKEEALRPSEPSAPHWEERYLEVVPGVFLIVGLLGTFVGLAISIDAAGDALSRGRHTVADMERQFDALAIAVNGIGVKFLSSLAGIVMHLVSRLLHGLLVLPAQRLRDHLRDAAEVSRHKLREQADRKCLSDIADSVLAIKSELKQFGALPEAIHGEAGALKEAATVTREAVLAVGAMVNKSWAALDSVREALRASEALGAQMKVSSAALSDSVSRAVAHLGQRMDGASESFALATKNLGGSLDATMCLAAERFAERVEGVGVRLGDTVSQTTAALDGAAQHLRVALDDHSGVLKAIPQASAGVLHELASGQLRVQQYVDAISLRSAELQQHREALVQLGERVEQAAVTIAASVGAFVEGRAAVECGASAQKGVSTDRMCEVDPSTPANRGRVPRAQRRQENQSED